MGPEARERLREALSHTKGKAESPEWVYDEDGYCFECGNGHWRHHAPFCQLAEVIEAARLLLAIDDAHNRGGPS